MRYTPKIVARHAGTPIPIPTPNEIRLLRDMDGLVDESEGMELVSLVDVEVDVKVVEEDWFPLEDEENLLSVD